VLWHRQNEDSRRLERIGGIGPLTASAYVASVGNAKGFKNGRQVAAWLGIVPRQDSTGGKTRLLGISKHGDVYLRTLFVHGARSVLRHLEHRPHQSDSWLRRLMLRRGKNVAAVALANKNARIAWALLAHQRDFQPDYVSTGPGQ
jgi:transposase